MTLKKLKQFIRDNPNLPDYTPIVIQDNKGKFVNAKSVQAFAPLDQVESYDSRGNKYDTTVVGVY